MSEYGTSSPHTEQTRLYLIRPPSATCTCRKEMSFSSVAENTLIGIVTIPKEMAPFQIACIAISSLSDHRATLCVDFGLTLGFVPGPLPVQQIGHFLCRIPQQVLSLARVEGEDSVLVTMLCRGPRLGRRADHRCRIPD